MPLNFRVRARQSFGGGRKKLFLFKILVMKKIIGLLALALTINSCDDGELIIEDIDFSEVDAANCGNIVYKMRDNEVFFFETDQYAAKFINDATPEGMPRTIELDANNRIFYRSYSGDLTSESICSIVQPPTPTVVEQWTYTGDNAFIEITTTPVIIANAELPGGEIIQRYKHHIVFRNVDKNTPAGTEYLGDETFGDYFTTPNTLPFNFDGDLEKCGNIITSINGSEALTLDIAPELIENAVTPAGTPRVGVLGTTTNKLLYTLFQSAVTPAYFCTAPTPSTPLLKEQWSGDAGVLNVTGWIEVTTTSSGPGVFEHEIHIKKARLRKGNSTFILADDYMLGTLITSI